MIMIFILHFRLFDPMVNGFWVGEDRQKLLKK